MQTVKQFSVMLINKPGRLSAILGALGKEKVNLRALSVMDSGRRSRLRFVPDEAATAARTLEAINAPYDVTDVLLVEVANQPGSFNKTCELLANEHLNIEYAYSSFNPAKGAKAGPLAVIKVNNLAKAQRVLGGPADGKFRGKGPGRRPVHAR